MSKQAIKAVAVRMAARSEFREAVYCCGARSVRKEAKRQAKRAERRLSVALTRYP